MKICSQCNGAIFEPTEVASYAGKACVCKFKTFQYEYTPPLMPLDPVTLLKNEVKVLHNEVDGLVVLVMLLRDEVRKIKSFK